ncbi:trypsin-like cysteine/serine peptidase domain-containing protein [Haematococcus lacustris]
MRHGVTHRVANRTVQPRGCIRCRTTASHEAAASPVKEENALVASRRVVIAGGFCTAHALHVGKPVQAAKLAQDDAVALATPPIIPPQPLTDRELQVIEVFNTNTYSVVNVFDNTLQGRSLAVAEADVPEGNGSGVVWDKLGHIVTNYHVLGNVLKSVRDDTAAAGRELRVARVTLVGQDGLQLTFDGILVGVDKARDLAVLRINAAPEQLVPVTLGSSEGLRVGQAVYAIGCPFGFDHTLTTGVISGLNREVKSVLGGTIPGCIQTDAAINPGNSGGPLLSSSGALLGLNTAIFTNTGTSVGVGFALPVDTVKRVVPQLIQNGKVVRPSLGAQFASAAVASRLRVGRGALVQTVAPGSAAEKAGVLPTRRTLSGISAGDVLVAIDSTPINSPADVTNVLDTLAISQRVTLRVLRNGGESGGQEQEVQLEAVLQSE